MAPAGIFSSPFQRPVPERSALSTTAEKLAENAAAVGPEPPAPQPISEASAPTPDANRQGNSSASFGFRFLEQERNERAQEEQKP